MNPGATPLGKGGMTSTTAAETRFKEIYEDHYGSILAYCRRRTARADAHDAAAEVFTVVWRKIDTVPEESKIRAWLYGIAYRVVSHQWRSRDRLSRLKVRIAGDVTESPATPESHTVRRAETERVIAAARRLSLPDQEILRLAGWEELPHSEISQILGVSISAVDQRFHRAKKRLAKQYDQMATHSPPASARKGGGA